MLALDPIWQPAIQQTNFRLLLNAMAYPGRCFTLHAMPKNGSVALSVLATLLDVDVTLSDPYHLLRAEDWPMLQAKSIAADKANYILCMASQPPKFTPMLGTLSEPEKSATLILIINKLTDGEQILKLSGPGIKDVESLTLDGFNSEWLLKREEWVGAFPLGVDMILVDEQQVVALPRTTKVELE